MTVAMPQPAHFRRYEGLPGRELVGPGLADLAAGRVTIAGLLVALASKRLLVLGIAVSMPERQSAPEDLYRLVVADVGERRAHARYNALRRRLASFLLAIAPASGTHASASEPHARDG